jgi:phosphoribosylcarboxyaminoimidazole (NCAIR) mutase
LLAVIAKLAKTFKVTKVTLAGASLWAYASIWSWTRSGSRSKMRGLRVIIAGAGLSAALPGVVAAHTELPVIGVPLTSSKSIAGTTGLPHLNRCLTSAGSLI